MPISVGSPRNAARLARPLAALVRATLASRGLKAGDIAIRLTGDAELRELNRRWRGLDRATDVLSFPRDDAGPLPGARVHGDLAISIARMEEQARRYRVSPGAELARLVVHGALHLAGLDHQSGAERRRMRRCEAAALAAGGGAIAALNRALGGAGRRRPGRGGSAAGARRNGKPSA